jgi:hypothetical protein
VTQIEDGLAALVEQHAQLELGNRQLRRELDEEQYNTRLVQAILGQRDHEIQTLNQKIQTLRLDTDRETHAWHAKETTPVLGDNQVFSTQNMPVFWRSERQVAERFEQLAERWRAETGFLSDPDVRYMNSAYQQIIGLGPAVLRYLVRDLERTQEHWFWALESIVGEDHARGSETVRAAVEAWLVWAKSVGLR